MFNIRYERRNRRKKQLRTNNKLKKRLFGHLFCAPCSYCKKVFMFDDLTVEHIVPLTLDGTNEDSNIALACAPCNQQKGREAWVVKKQLMREHYEQHPAQHQI